MKKQCFLFSIFSLGLLTISCASPMKEKLFSEVTPQFDGTVTPISIPIQPEYKPASGNAKFNAIGGYIVGNKKNSYEMSTSGNFNVSQLGDSLIWNVKLTRMKIGNSIFAPTLPIIDGRLLTNKIGIIEESEISLPAFDKDDMAENQRKKIIDELKYQINSFSRGLPSMFFASRPTAKIGDFELLPVRIATTEGSLITMPLSLTYTRVFAVPRSMARSLENTLITAFKIKFIYPC